MIIEFEVEKKNIELIHFLKNKRWPESKKSKNNNEDTMFFSKNILAYDNYRRLLNQIIIFPDNRTFFRNDNPKEFIKQFSEAEKHNIQLKSGDVPATELLETVREAHNLGKFILRIIGDSTRPDKMEKLNIPISQFNQYFFLQESMEIKFKDN